MRQHLDELAQYLATNVDALPLEQYLWLAKWHTRVQREAQIHVVVRRTSYECDMDEAEVCGAFSSNERAQACAQTYPRKEGMEDDTDFETVSGCLDAAHVPEGDD